MDLQIIGVSIFTPRTEILNSALEILYPGKPTCYLGKILFHNPEKFSLWLKKTSSSNHQQQQQQHPSNIELRSILRGHVACIDWPGAILYKQLLHVHPQAKIIIFTEEVDSCIERLRKTILKLIILYQSECLLTRLYRRYILKYPLEEINYLMEKFVPGFEHYSNKKWRDFLRSWNAEIKSNTNLEEILVYDITQGWQPLCEFLNIPQPNCLFPNVISPEDDELLQFVEKVEKVNFVGSFVSATLSFAIVMTTAFCIAKYYS